MILDVLADIYDAQGKLKKKKDSAKYYYNELRYDRFEPRNNKERIRGELFSPNALLDLETEKQIKDSCLIVNCIGQSREYDLEKVPEGFIPIGFAHEGVIYADPNKEDFLNQNMVWEQTYKDDSKFSVPYCVIKKEFGSEMYFGEVVKEGLTDIQIAKHFATLAYRYAGEAKEEKQELKVAVMANTAKYMLAESVYGEMKDLCKSDNKQVFGKLMDIAKQYRKDSEKLKLDELIEKYENVSVQVEKIRQFDKQLEDKKEADKIKKEVEARAKAENKKQKEAKKDKAKIKL